MSFKHLLILLPENGNIKWKESDIIWFRSVRGRCRENMEDRNTKTEIQKQKYENRKSEIEEDDENDYHIEGRFEKRVCEPDGGY